MEEALLETSKEDVATAEAIIATATTGAEEASSESFPVADQRFPRPLSVSFQFRASGKETDVATPLGLEKYGKVDFTLGKLTKRHPKNGQK